MSDERSPLEVEIMAEQVRALTRATELLERSIHDLARFDARSGSSAQPIVRRRERLLREAQRVLWNLIVQREAMGIVHHQILFEVLRVPPEVRAPLGGWAGPSHVT